MYILNPTNIPGKKPKRGSEIWDQFGIGIEKLVLTCATGSKFDSEKVISKENYLSGLCNIEYYEP